MWVDAMMQVYQKYKRPSGRSIKVWLERSHWEAEYELVLLQMNELKFEQSRAKSQQISGLDRGSHGSWDPVGRF